MPRRATPPDTVDTTTAGVRRWTLVSAVLGYSDLPAQSDDRNAALANAVNKLREASAHNGELLAQPEMLAKLADVRKQSQADARFCWKESSGRAAARCRVNHRGVAPFKISNSRFTCQAVAKDA